MIGYHVTTPKKLERYKATGVILSPVRFWAFENSAMAWANKTGRTIILKIEAYEPYPLPDHKPFGHAFWNHGDIDKWEIYLQPTRKGQDEA
jgi:hypothetical protein